MFNKLLKRFIGEPIMIGMSPDMDASKRHGIVHVHGVGKALHFDFISDDRSRLCAANAKEISDIFTQVEMLGYQPISIEIHKLDGHVQWHDYKAA